MDNNFLTTFFLCKILNESKPGATPKVLQDLDLLPMSLVVSEKSSGSSQESRVEFHPLLSPLPYTRRRDPPVFGRGDLLCRERCLCRRIPHSRSFGVSFRGNVLGKNLTDSEHVNI